MSADLGRKVASAIEEAARRIEKVDIARLTTNMVGISAAAMSMYVMYAALYSVLPAAAQYFYALAAIIGYAAPLMIASIMLSITISLIRRIMK